MSTSSTKMRLLQRENADHTAAGAVILEPHASRDPREARVVLAKPRVQARAETTAALPHDDRAPADHVAVVSFHAQPLRVRVAAVARAALSFFVSHFVSGRDWGTWGLSVRRYVPLVPRSQSPCPQSPCPQSPCPQSPRPQSPRPYKRMSLMRTCV